MPDLAAGREWRIEFRFALHSNTLCGAAEFAEIVANAYTICFNFMTLGRPVKPVSAVVLLTLSAALLSAADAPPLPLLVHIGGLTLQPTAFFDAIGMSRSATTPDSVLTHFGSIPLAATPGESLWTERHSRLMLHTSLRIRSITFLTYLESDFMNFTAGQSPYHWRQYWGAAQYGQWEILGGQAWSLLRPNRSGTISDRDTMNTDVVDPAYHVGLIGSRVRQIRLSRSLPRNYQATMAWESDGNILGKVVRDLERTHLEISALAGRFGRRAASASAVATVAPHIRLVAQQYWSKRAAQYTMGVAPVGVNGMATLEGVESQLTRRLEAFAYAGLVYAAHGVASGNRLVRQWSVGVNQKWTVPSLYGSFLASLQYSHLDRAIWSGRTGQMDYLMYRFRYTFN